MHVTLNLKKYPKAIFLMGPTASGKTKIAEKLKKYLPVEIISVDSACIYRDMNIGTAKPILSGLECSSYHLIDICDPSERYSIKDFKNDALDIMKKIILNGRIPLLVGGITWISSGFYTIKEAERGVILRLGKFHHIVQPGLNWRPSFIDTIYPVNVESVRELAASGIMLTSDENVVRVEMNVQYKVIHPKNYLFSVTNADNSLRQATDSALRGVIGKYTMDRILTEGRTLVRSDTQKILEETIQPYNMGIELLDVNFQTARPPEEVKAAFDDAIAARENEQQYIREAEAYANEVQPQANGKAQRILEEGRAYKARTILEAQGEVQRFTKVLPEYKIAPKITRERLYIDTMERILNQLLKSSELKSSTHNINSTNLYQNQNDVNSKNYQDNSETSHNYKKNPHTKKKTVKHLDAKIQTMENQADRFVTMEKKDLIVDSYIKWKIINFSRYYLATGGGDVAQGEVLLKRKFSDRLRSELGRLDVKGIVTDSRNKLMSDVRFALNNGTSGIDEEDNIYSKKIDTTVSVEQTQEIGIHPNSMAALGIEVVDVRIKQINLPSEVSDAIYQRMRAEREAVARRHRSQGKEEAEKLRATADYKVTRTLAEAKRQSLIIKGEADAETAKLYALSFNADPEFYVFIRSLRAYENSFSNTQDLILIDSKSNFLRFMHNAEN
uniref:Band 7 domain-containing protein n=1 Tax=Glossina pallidipes TaxID=7398 RepID=A0A1A9Z0Y3_GLOPL